MNFFEQQERAKKNTSKLVILFILAVVCILAILVYVSCLFFVDHSQSVSSNYSPIQVFGSAPTDKLLFFIIFFFLVILAGSLSKIHQLSSGGHVVAESLRGRLVTKDIASDMSEITLLNVVEEIAIASGISAPPVYIIEDHTINAFAAGLSYDDAVIGITRGAIENLSRDELQGVIAHEFSHIFNGDMNLNIKTIGIINGILFIALLGGKIMRYLGGSRRSSSSKDDGKAIAIMLTFGAILYAIGLVGVFFGNAIKAAINRQREYLADASAVQFTRNPEGIAGALKKIGALGSQISSPSASEFSHLYFSSGVKNFFSFASHPPLEDRIKKLDPSWDGNYAAYLALHKKPNQKSKKRKEQIKKEKIAKVVTTAVILDGLNNIGNVSQKQIENAKEEIAKIPQALTEFMKNPLEAGFVIFSMLLDDKMEIRRKQINIIAKNYENFLNTSNISQNFIRVSSCINDIKRGDYLKIILLCTTTLKQMDIPQYKVFKTTVDELIEADNKISWFEWNMKYLILHPLDIFFNLVKIPDSRHKTLRSIKFEVELYLSALCYNENRGDEKAKAAFDTLKDVSRIKYINYIPYENITKTLLESSLNEIGRAKPVVRRQVLEMAISCVKSDEIITPSELESIHALAALVRLPFSLE